MQDLERAGLIRPVSQNYNNRKRKTNMIDDADRLFNDEVVSKAILDTLERVFGGKVHFDSREQKLIVYST